VNRLRRINIDATCYTFQLSMLNAIFKIHCMSHKAFEFNKAYVAIPPNLMHTFGVKA
jgi:hypothetical protein